MPIRTPGFLLPAAFAVIGCTVAGLPSPIAGIPDVNATTSAMTPVATAAHSPAPRQTPTKTLIPSPLPICSQPAGVDLDGLELAFAARRDGDSEVYVVRGDGSDLRQLTNNATDDIEPVWSPDGRRLAYVADADGDPTLYVSEADGTKGSPVATDAEPELGPSSLVWAPDGNKIAFRNSEGIYLVDFDSGDTANLIRGAGLVPRDLSISSDGSTVAFAADNLAGTRMDVLHIVGINGRGLRQLQDVRRHAFRPRWHPMEQKILVGGYLEGANYALYVISTDGSHEPIPGPFPDGLPMATWSPDGSMVGYIAWSYETAPNGKRIYLNSLRVATADGYLDLALVRPLNEPGVGFVIGDFAWAPDGRHIAYTTSKDRPLTEGVDLFVLDVCSGSSNLVAETVEFYSSPSWRLVP